MTSRTIAMHYATSKKRVQGYECEGVVVVLLTSQVKMLNYYCYYYALCTRFEERP
jgi:hypothetical protein